ncbi:MAG: hypothetical protein KatS3mg102_0019 [Planctomycetota bacterium]|nr:MAG: hypothetical protein KatS3mg102_0019 [Planctomycetota bacterium]
MDRGTEDRDEQRPLRRARAGGRAASAAAALVRPRAPARWLSEAVVRRLDRYVPRALAAQGPDALSRARLAVAAAFALAAAHLMGVGYAVYYDKPLNLAIAGVAAVLMAGAPWLLRRCGSIELVGNVLAGVLFVEAAVMAALHQGVRTPVLVGTAAVCLLAAVLCGKRWSAVWALLSALAVWSFYALEQLGVRFPGLLGSGKPGLDFALVLSVLLATVFVLAVVYESLKGQALQELHQTAHELEAARRRAERASEGKSRFVADLSHEIRTPMHAITGMAELLLRSPLDAQARERVETIRRSAQALVALLADVVDLSRIEAGRVELAQTPFDLVAVLEEVAALAQVLAHERGLGFELRLAPELPRGLCGDPVRLRQVVHNLLANALRYTERGGVELRAGGRARGDGTAELEIAVRDTGVGIPRERLGELFEPFTQLHRPAPGREGGSGLGLAICRRLVEAMGGTIAVASEPGRGSTFTVRLVLPLSPVAGQEQAVPLPRSEVASGTGEGRAPAAGGAVSRAAPAPPAPLQEPAPPLAGRVLVVEDNEAGRRVLEEILELFGCEVESAPDGRAALELHAARPFDLILMDCHLPRMDGLEATRALRRREAESRARRTPVIAVTASVMPGERERCQAAGMDGYLAKPFDLEQLRELLARYLPPRARLPAAAEG